MPEFTHQDCEAYADSVVAAGDDPTRLKMLLELAEISLRQHEPGIIIAVGSLLRGPGASDWAEYALQLASRMPGARAKALFELSEIAPFSGRHELSALLLGQLEAEYGLDPFQQRRYAHRLAHIGRLEEAVGWLEKSLEQEPGSLEECVALRQYFDYRRKFPMDEALRRCAALNQRYPLQTAAEVTDDVLEALRNKRPYSMVRVNDGEGCFLHFSIEDESEFAALYRANRAYWHGIIFGDQKLLFDADFLEVARQFNARLENADCIGADHYGSLHGEYSWGSTRNVPCIFNIIRKLELIEKRVPAGAASIKMCSPQINQQLLFEGHLERIIGSQSRIGLISAHTSLPKALTERFALSEVIYHRTPGEALVHSGLEKEPIRVWHGRISAELAQVEPGTLYLVGAGIFSKIYCDLVKRAGGVGLDIGAVADIWVRAPTRGLHTLPEIQALGLVEA